MGSEWVQKSLGEILKFSNGKSSPERTESGKFPVFGSNGPIGKASLTNSPSNTIIVGRVGSYCGSTYLSAEECWVTDNAIRATSKNGHDIFFAYYLLKALNLNDRRSGSGQPLLNQSILTSIEIVCPPPSEQREIGALLRVLDDRIDLLRQINTTLEAIAQALFKSWFVDFDPARAKTEGREPEGMDATTAALFPSEFEESELGLIPKGWKVERLEAQLELAYGKALKAADRSEGDIPVYGSGGITGFHDTALISGPAIIVGRKGSVGKIYWEAHPCFPIDTVFYVKQKGYAITFLFYLLQGLGLEQMNTDAAVPGLNRNNVYRLPVIAPSPAVLAVWDDFASKIRKKTTDATDQTKTLVDLRDTLLPRLISGKLRLPEAMKATQGALA